MQACAIPGRQLRSISVSITPAGVIDTEMLRSCLPGMAQACIKPDQWSQGMVDFLLQLGPEQNGKALTAP